MSHQSALRMWMSKHLPPHCSYQIHENRTNHHLTWNIQSKWQIWPLPHEFLFHTSQEHAVTKHCSSWRWLSKRVYGQNTVWDKYHATFKGTLDSTNLLVGYIWLAFVNYIIKHQMLLTNEQFHLKVSISDAESSSAPSHPSHNFWCTVYLYIFSVRTSNLWNADKDLGQSLVMSNNKLKITWNP